MKNSRILLFGAVMSALTIDAFAETKTVTTQGYVDNAVATKQDKLSGTNGYAVTYGASAGTTDGRQIVTVLDTVSATSTALPTAGAVVAALNDKQNKLPAGTSGALVTYSGTAGTVGSTAVYNPANAYSGQTEALVQAQHVNSAIANGFNAHLSCNRRADPNDETSDCLLWNINTLTSVM